MLFLTLYRRGRSLWHGSSLVSVELRFSIWSVDARRPTLPGDDVRPVE